MKHRAMLLLAAAALTSVFGCDRHRDAVEPVPVPSAPPPQKAAAPRPATRPVSIITISDQPVIFPPAKLVLQQTATGVTATLFSDDPPEAIKDDYRGNSFRFVATYDGGSFDDISGQPFLWKTSAEDKRDTQTGIFLNGQQQMVSPTSATLTLTKVGQQWTASLAGEFQFVDNTKENATPLTVHAYADMTADLVTTSDKR